MVALRKEKLVDFDAYRNAYFARPEPKARFRFRNAFGVTLYFEAFDDAVRYYSDVLGPAAYAEGEGTRGWRVGDGWLTLLRGTSGNPTNVEITFELADPDEAERCQRAFVAAGGTGAAPSDQLMYRPVRSCPVRDPFGTELLIVAPFDPESL